MPGDDKGSTLRIVTDIETLPAVHPAGLAVETSCVSAAQTLAGKFRLLLRSFSCDYLLVRFEPAVVLPLCLLKLLWPFQRSRLVTLDLFISPASGGWRSRLHLALTRLLLRQVHLFLVHVKDTSRYQRHLRAAPGRFQYVPYKVNHYPMVSAMQTADDGYIFCGGLSRRDFVTLFEAVRGLPCKVMVVTVSNEVLVRHGTVLDEDSAPPNVEVVRTDGSLPPFLRYMARARLVVIPIQKDILTQAGIAVYLLAMALRKCVIISSGPGVEDVLENDQAIIVPAADSQSLRSAIERAYVDDEWRKRFEESGYRYAQSLGGDDRFLAGLLRQLASDASTFTARGARGRP